MPIGGVTFIGATASEAFGWEVDPHWRLVETLAFNGYWPLDPRDSPDSYSLDGHLVAERSFRKDALGLDLRSAYSLYGEVRGPTAAPDGTAIPDGVVTPRQQVLINELTAKWRHDYGHFWNTELDAGVVETNRVEGGGTAIWQPAGRAALRYLHDYGQVDLSYAHTVQPNVLLGQTFAVDQVLLRGNVPLGRETHVVFDASLAYQYARQIDFDTGGDLSHTNVFLVDATLGYAPRKEIQVFARYQFFDQLGTVGDFDPQPSFLRHVVLVGIIGTYPGEAAATVPTRQALRVDRSDMTGIPAPHSEPVTPK